MHSRPLIQNPLTDFNYLVSPSYRSSAVYGMCAKLELKFLNCVEAYGTHKARRQCADILYDTIECKTGAFQKSRYAAIQKERMKQYRAGKLDRPFVEHPPMDNLLFLQ